MEKEKTKVLVNNTIMMYILSIAKLVIPLISLPYLTRVLSVECYGSVAYARSVVSYLQILIDFGFILSTTKDIVNLIKKKKSPAIVIGDTMYAQGLLCIVSTIAMLIMCFGMDILKGYELFAMFTLVPSILSMFLFEYVFRAYEKMDKIAIRYVIARVISLILILFFVKGDSDIYLMPIFDTIATIVAIVLVSIQMKKLGVSVSFSFKRFMHAIKVLKESFIFFLSNFATTAFSALNTLLIGIFLTKSDVAYWSVAMQLVSAVEALYTPITNSVFPTMLKEKDLKIVHKILLIYMPLIFAGCGLILLLGDWAVTLVLEDSYIMSSTLLKYLIPVLIASFPGLLYGWPCLGAINKQGTNTMATIVAALFQTFGIGILLIIGQFNLLAICIVRCLAEFVLAGYKMIAVHKYKNLFDGGSSKDVDLLEMVNIGEE